MQDYNTIIGVITMHLNGCSYGVIQKRYRIGSSTAQLIIHRFHGSQLSFTALKQMDPKQVEKLIYPPDNIRRKEVAEPEFQKYYDWIHAPNSRVNISYCWIDYKLEHPDGYEKSQFYEYYNRFVNENFGGEKATMAVERVPGEKMFIDWVGDQPHLPRRGHLRMVWSVLRICSSSVCGSRNWMNWN